MHSPMRVSNRIGMDGQSNNNVESDMKIKKKWHEYIYIYILLHETMFILKSNMNVRFASSWLGTSLFP